MLHNEKAGYKPAEFEKIMPPAGFNDITRGMYELFTPLAKSKIGLAPGSNPLSWRVLPADVLPAPGVCVTEQANIYIAHDLTAGMTLADFRRVDFYLRFARVVGIPLHEIAHWLYSPDDWAAWVKRMSKHGKHIGTLCVLFEEPRIENQLLVGHFRGEIPGPVEWDNSSRRRVSGLMTDEMVAAMHATSDEHMSRNVAQSGEEGESGLTTNYFNKAMILVYGRVVGGSAVEIPGSLTAKAVLTLRAVVAEALEAKHADDLATGKMSVDDMEGLIEAWWEQATHLLNQAVWLSHVDNQWRVAEHWSRHVKELNLPKSIPDPPPSEDEPGDGTPQADPGDTTPPDEDEQEPGQDGQEQGQEQSDDDPGPGDSDEDSEPQSGSEGDEDTDEGDESDDPSTATGEAGDSEEADGQDEQGDPGDSDDSGTGDESIESEDGDEQSDEDTSGKLGDNDKGGSALNDLKDLIEQMRQNAQDDDHDFEDDKPEEQQEQESETATAALEKVQIRRGEVASNRRTRRVSANSAWNGRRVF